MRNVFGLLIIWVILPTKLLAQSHNVDWIHGLGGSSTSWTTVDQTYYYARQIPASTRNSYNTGSGIPTFATDVQNNSGGSNAIAIGHSLGGDAIRQVDVWNPTQWVGSITVGSPLAGAQIATSTRNGVAQQFISQGIVELLRGPQAGSIVLEIFGFGIPIAYVAHYGTVNSDNIASSVVNQITGALNLSNATSDDLNPTGSYMQGIAGQGTATPKVQIWGREDDPIFWRLGGTFAGETDQWGVDLANTACGVYTTAADIEYVTSWLPPFIFAHGYYNWRGHQWMAGVNWIADKANPAWQAVIGAAYYNSVIVPVWEYDYSCGQNAQLCDPNDTSCDDSQCFHWVDQLVNVYTVDQSDGVVPAPSQRNDGKAWRGYVLEAPGINHMEMLQYGQISPSLNTVFDRTDSNISTVFKIDPR